MKRLEIYKFQLETIENTLRLVSNMLHSQNKETSLDRDITQSLAFARNALSKDIDKSVNRI